MSLRRETGTVDLGDAATLVEAFGPGDVLVVNDAATLPAALRGTLAGAPVEARLVSVRPFRAVVLGAGDWRTRTEHRDHPRLRPGDTLDFSGLHARVGRCEGPMAELRFDRDGDALWQALYRRGSPVQYSYLHRDLELWDVQTPFAGEPWAVEMPSAARWLTVPRLIAVRNRGATVMPLRHAAGLSSIGDDVADRVLPLAERWHMPIATAEAVNEARRVIAVGTSVVRALESAAEDGIVHPGNGLTDLRVGADRPARIANALVTGMHEPGTSHWELLRGFASDSQLGAVHEVASRHGLLGHEFGDLLLLA